MQHKSSAVSDRSIDQTGQRILTVFATMLTGIWGPERGGMARPGPAAIAASHCAFNCGLRSNGRYIALCGGQWRWFAVSKIGCSAVFLTGRLSACYLATIETGP